jgi:hypothetical protein
MSHRARVLKQNLRRVRAQARSFYFQGWQHGPQRRFHDEANEAAQTVKIPEGYEPISHKKRVAFRLPKAGETFINSDGQLDRAVYQWEESAFGHGPRWIVRKKRRKQ